jgi:ABC-type phosphate transport system substrate-binding protein
MELFHFQNVIQLLKGRRSDMKKIIFIFIIACFFLGTAAQEEEALGVIVNKSNDLASINTRILRNIYLGKQTIWPNNKTIVVAVLKEGKIHDKFLKTIVQQNSTQFSLYWKNLTFTGTGIAPKVFDTEEEVKAFVKDNPGAIGYVPLSAIDDSVKKLPIM